jgi:hypothetical protein
MGELLHVVVEKSAQLIEVAAEGVGILLPDFHRYVGEGEIVGVLEIQIDLLPAQPASLNEIAGRTIVETSDQSIADGRIRNPILAYELHDDEVDVSGRC